MLKMQRMQTEQKMQRVEEVQNAKNGKFAKIIYNAKSATKDKTATIADITKAVKICQE